MRKPLLHLIHDYFFPHERNNHRPHIFRTASVAFIILGVLVLEGAYFAQVKLVFPHTNFLGAVLPGALVALTNDDRAANNLSAVSEDSLLARAAQDAANDMATYGYFAHVSPDGKDPWYWLNKVGYKYSYAGENLAVNFTDSQEVQSAWMESPTHRSNIMKREYTRVGFGTANGMYEGRETTFVVSFFATPAEASSRPQKVAVVDGNTTNAVPIDPITIVSTETDVVAPVAEVLGAQAQVAAVSANPSPIASFFAMTATSPTLTITYILSVLSAIILLLLIVAIVVRARAIYIETIAGALILLLVVLGLLFFNTRTAAKVQISPDNQSATIILST